MSLRIVEPHKDAPGHKRNPGFPLDLDWVARIKMNRSALERRAATIGTHRSEDRPRPNGPPPGTPVPACP
jgi:deoxyribose-phosphate aldolase